jgi:hypothetical protein
VESIISKEQRILEILNDVKSILGAGI